MGLDFLIITFFSHIGERLSLIILLIVYQTGLILIFFTNITNFLVSGLSSALWGEVGLEMQGIGHTNDIVLHRFVCLQ